MSQKKRRREIAADRRKTHALLTEAKIQEAEHAKIILRGILVGAISVYPKTNEIGFNGIRYFSDRCNWNIVVEAIGRDLLLKKIEELEKTNGFKLLSLA